MNPDEDKPRTPLLEQWWLGFVALFLLGAVVMLLLLSKAEGAECTLTWDQQTNITGFRLYCGIDLLASVPASTTEITVTLPNAACTIALVAVNEAEQSQPAILHTVFIEDQDSTDLMAWRTLRGYHREFIPGKRFYRTRIQTP